MLDTIHTFQQQFPLLYKVIIFVILVVGIVLTIQLVKRLLRRKLPHATTRYKTEKGIEVIGYILIIFLSIAYFSGNIKDFTIAIGLLSAGIAFTLQELFLSIAGSIYIFASKVYKPGDRIELSGIKGDVIDVDSVYTTMMEIGEWVDSDNYSGRIVKISNAFVFKGAVYNYSQDFPFVWDEINIPIRHNSDVVLAKQLITEVAKEELSEFAASSKEKWKTIVKKYYIENAQLDPSISVKITDNWITLNLRYIVDYKKRRTLKHTLNECIFEKIKANSETISIASSTYEIVGMPDVRVDINNKK